MSLLRGLIVLVIGNFCFINFSSSIALAVGAELSPKKAPETQHNDHLKDPVTDLKRLSSITSINSGKRLDEELDEGASAHLGTILSGIIDEGSSESRLGRRMAAPIYDASPDEYLIESLAHGKRRFDGDNVAALASTGRMLKGFEATHLMQQNNRADQLALNQAASRAYSRRQIMMQNSYNNANLLGRGRKNWPEPNQLEGQRQNSNRRSMSAGKPFQQQQQRGSRGRQGIVKPAPARRSSMSANNRLIKANFRQLESRKRVSKPVLSKKSSEEADEDDIFRDDDEDAASNAANNRNANLDDERASSDRRSDDDGESKDDDEDDDDASGGAPRPQPAAGKRAGSGRTRGNRRATGRDMKAASEERENSVDDQAGANEDGEEDSDSSNDFRQTAPMGGRAAIYSNASAGKALQGPINGPFEKPNENNNPNNDDSTSGEDDSDQSATQLKHSSVELQAAAGSHHGHHGHYYQHVEVPKKKAWKFGFKRGNHKHEIERHEKGHKHKFHSSFKWHAKEKCKKKSKCKSVGHMTWEYKHAKKHHH